MTNRSECQFLLEIGVEEIPSRYLDGLIEHLGEGVNASLIRHRLAPSAIRWDATPRRLVVWGDVPARQAAQMDVVKGPLYDLAYREGRPSAALEGFCRRVGVAADALVVREEGAKTYVAAVIQKPVAEIEDILPTVVAEAFAALPLPRSMRWGSGAARFVRPVRWCVVLVDQKPLAVTVADVESRPITYGNRTDHPEAMAVRSVAHYFEVLAEKGRVMLSRDDRRRVIREEGERLAAAIGGVMAADPALLQEVSALVEWPVPFLGHFDPAFLEIPEEILITSMKVHQRYFPVQDASGRLLPAFVGVRNGVGTDLNLVRHGNEKVLRARLSDAVYFFRSDAAHRLDDWRPALDQVVFHTKLGTYGDKIRRMQRLFERTAGDWDLDDAQRAAVVRSVELAKCDLLSHVVQEFPELEGVMGKVYAERQGESAEVSRAIGDQYRPASPDEPIPDAPVAQAVGVLDRVDTVVMGIAHGLNPTGSEDPFGLRRYALAIGRIAMEGRALSRLPVRRLVAAAVEAYGLASGQTEEIYQFVRTRLENYLAESYPPTHVRAALGGPAVWSSVPTLLEFLAAGPRRPGWDDFLTAYKRIDRVVGSSPASEPDDYPGRWERALADDAYKMEAAADLDSWWRAAAAAGVTVSQFFDEVLVMDPDASVRARRIGLLTRVRRAMSRYFDVAALS